MYKVFNFRIMVKIHGKLTIFQYKNDHNSKSKNHKNVIGIRFLLKFSTFCIFHINLTTSEKKIDLGRYFCEPDLDKQVQARVLNPKKKICEPDSDANQFRLESSILKKKNHFIFQY